ncbi:glycosyl hydrolase family 18 protein [Paenibacillus sp. Marseille-Q4541]|uniref:glycosyl hydrolase family 18 protein n=1 Tax=Paenibacillus sp. Marseille-Q4541 TaxID=2831522 RepID=UPI001BAE0404|nr:glycosyl hydrolase family 18 protein [Paenibacillus sp. Marseille-Q4541]
MRRRYRKRRTRTPFWKKAFALGCLAALAYILITTFVIQNVYEDADWKGFDKPVFVKGELMDYEAKGSKESLKLPLPVLQEKVDPSIRYEEAEGSIILTSSDKVLHLSEGKEQGELNGKSYTLKTAPEEDRGILYIPVQAIKEVYGITIHESADTGAVLLMNQGEVIEYAKAVGGNNKDGSEETISLYKEPNNQAAIVHEMNVSDRVRIWSSDGKWLFVQLDNGYAGYVLASNVKQTETATVPKLKVLPTAAEQRWKDKSINLTWEAVYNRAADPATLSALKGVNVVSPTWFEISDNIGTVSNKGDLAYVKKAKSLGIEVWGLLSNGFDADLTTEALSSYERRNTIIKQMMEYAKTYQLDGINIDFENVYTEDGANVTQFMRELRPYAKENELVLSIAVTPKSNSEMWSKFLDRRSLGQIADYMMVMAYDEHWASSPVAGSVASIPWVSAAMNKIMDEDEVPANKLVLGVPSYTRVWSEEEVEGEIKVSSKAIGMDTAQEIITSQKLNPQFSEDTGQNYVEYEKDGILNKIWLEDKTSLRARVDLAEELKLAGVATWSRSLANDGAWAVLNRIHLN